MVSDEFMNEIIDSMCENYDEDRGLEGEKEKIPAQKPKVEFNRKDVGKFRTTNPRGELCILDLVIGKEGELYELSFDQYDGSDSYIGDMVEEWKDPMNVEFSSGVSINDQLVYENDVVYIAGLGNVVMQFPFTDLFDAIPEGDVERIVGYVSEVPDAK